MSDGEFYNIEKILARRMFNGVLQYKIKWEGYPLNQSTWEPMKNLESAKELIEEYNQSHPLEPTKKHTTKKKDATYTKKKRKPDNIEKVEKMDKIAENVPPTDKNEDKTPNIKDEDSKEKNNENPNVKTFIIDDSLKSVQTVKQQNQQLMAVVDKLENGDIKKENIPTEELRKTNPWILLDFYESKIKFT